MKEIFRILKSKRKIFLSYVIILFNLYFIYNSSFHKKIIIEREIEEIESYYELCNNKSLLDDKYFQKVNNPKISIISPVLNKENYLNRFLRSIENQIFDDVEIIFVDDKSNDKSVEIIKNSQIQDKRIILIKNKNNKGTLISRNIGALKSRGEYLLFIDPDDILSHDILNSIYNLAKKYNYELIRFNLYIGNNTINLKEIVETLNYKPIYQPELYIYLFHGTGKLEIIDYYITNKLIKRNLFIKALININQSFLNNYMIDCEDGLINFMLYKTSKSLFFTKKIGYYYIKHEKSITKKGNFHNRLKSTFIYLYYLLINTRNNNIEKQFADYYFLAVYRIHKNEIINLFENMRNDSVFYLKIINFLNNYI